MALTIGDNFNYQGQKPNFERDSFNTLAEMKAFAETSIDDGHISYCVEDENHYVFNSSNEENETTGKWRSFTTNNAEYYITSIDDIIAGDSWTSNASYIKTECTIRYDTYWPEKDETLTSAGTIFQMSIPIASSSNYGVESPTHYNAVDSLIDVGSQTASSRMIIPIAANCMYSYEYNGESMGVNTVEGYVFNTETGKFEGAMGSAYNIYPQIPVVSSTTYGVMSPADKATLDSLESTITSKIISLGAVFADVSIEGHYELSGFEDAVDEPTGSYPSLVVVNRQYYLADIYGGTGVIVAYSGYNVYGNYTDVNVGDVVYVYSADTYTGIYQVVSGSGIELRQLERIL